MRGPGYISSVSGRAIGKRWPARWALGSLLLHGLLLVVAGRRHPAPPEPARAVVSNQAELAVEVEPAPATSDASVAVPATSEPEQAHPGVAAHRSARPVTKDEATAAEAIAGADGAVEAVESAPAAEPDGAPHLSLAQLGVDGTNPFLDHGDPAAARVAKAARVKRRLDRALAQGLMNDDVARGRGAGSPVLRSLEASVYASEVPLNGKALFVFVINSEGNVVSGQVDRASGEREAWVRVARQTAQAFANRKLAVPKGKAVKLTVAVSSHLELPSGADPGLAVNAFGIPLKKGDGPRSTKLDLSLFPIPTAALTGDPADIGARPRRMVHAHVVSEEIL